MFAHSYARPLTAPNLHGSGACAIDNGGSGTRAIKDLSVLFPLSGRGIQFNLGAYFVLG